VTLNGGPKKDGIICEKIYARKKTVPKFLTGKIFRTKNFERKKWKNRKSQNGTIFKFRSDIAISGSGGKIWIGKISGTIIFTAKNFR